MLQLGVHGSLVTGGNDGTKPTYQALRCALLVQVLLGAAGSR